MMSSRNRAISILELLSHHAWGLSARDIANRLDIPFAATQRLLSGLIESGYVHGGTGKADLYRLRVKLPALGLAYLGATGVTDLVQPILDDLAKRTSELVRLAVIEADRLTWVAKSQGARSGLLYNPDTDAEVHLPATANGRAWLSCLGKRQARSLIEKSAPDVIDQTDAVLRDVAIARAQGYAVVSESYEAGTSAVAAPIRRGASGNPIGTVSIAGPTIRMTPDRIQEFVPWLLASAAELGAAAGSSPLFKGP